jgi:hypothetical protein
MRYAGALCLIATLAACSAPLAGGSVTHIDYLQMVRVAGITYLAQPAAGGRALTPGDLGPVVGSTRVRLADYNNPSRQLQDGDATYLPRGTKLYQVNGYLPRFRLTAAYMGQWPIFESYDNPSARRGADLLDIQGKVASIEINDPAQQMRAVGVISAAAEIALLVDSIDSAPVTRAPRPRGGQEYELVFKLKDGTISARAFDVGSGWLAGALLLPPEVGQSVQAAVAAKAA